MRRGQHAADDGSFSRSAGGAMARGIALIVVAVLLGVVLLQATDDEEPFSAAETTEDPADGAATDTTGSGNAGDPVTSDTTLPAPRDPSEVRVLVANGAGIPGLAGRITDGFEAQNYLTAEPTDTLAPADTSMVFHAAGYEAEALVVASLLNPPPSTAPLPEPPPVADVAGANIVVVAAADQSAATG